MSEELFLKRIYVIMQVFLYKNKPFSLQPGCFLIFYQNSAITVSQVFLKILKISCSIKKATMRREIEVLFKNICEKDVVCTFFPFN